MEPRVPSINQCYHYNQVVTHRGESITTQTHHLTTEQAKPETDPRQQCQHTMQANCSAGTHLLRRCIRVSATTETMHSRLDNSTGCSGCGRPGYPADKHFSSLRINVVVLFSRHTFEQFCSIFLSRSAHSKTGLPKLFKVWLGFVISFLNEPCGIHSFI